MIETCFEEEALGPDQAAMRFQSAAIRDRLLELGVLQRERGGQLRISFVGLAVAKGKAFQFLPKVLAGSPGPHKEAMREVVRALRHYARWRPPYHEASPLLAADPAEPALSALALADWIIRDYLASGIYRRAAERHEFDGAGQVSWGRTIEQVPPVFVRGSPVYLRVITRSAAHDPAHFVSRLHRHFIEEASSRFGHLLGFPSLALDHEPFEPFPETPGLTTCRTYLRREAQTAYSERAMRLLPMLLAWATGQAAGNGVGLTLYGTTSFQLVWEAACAATLGNERDLWQSEMPAPVWTGISGVSEEARTFIPDIVTSLEKPRPEGGWLLVADAKYYRLRMPPGLSGQPGVNDVAKQLWYEEVLGPPARVHGYGQITSAFVLPGADDGRTFWQDGRVALAGLGASKVLVTKLAFLDALRRYVEGRRLDGEIVKASLRDAVQPAMVK